MLDRIPNIAAAARLLIGGRNRGRGGVVLGYHDIVAGNPATEYDVTVDALRMHVMSLRRWGLRIVPLADFTARLLAAEPIDDLVALTFDDALEGVFQHAWPVLTEIDAPFTVFAVSSELGSAPAWWPDAGRIMPTAHLAEMAAAGVSVEPHSRHHPSLPTLRGSALTDEIAGAKAEIEDLTGVPTAVFAYPFGHHDPAVRDATVEAGFKAGFSFINGRVTHGQDVFKIPRFTMTSAHHRLRLALHVSRSAESWPDTQYDVVTGEG